MSKPAHTAIEVSDFGPIWRGRVELRPLTVFTGHSNTGKSWLATLVYALAQHSIKSQHRSMLSGAEHYDELAETSPEQLSTDVKLDELGSDYRIRVSDALSQYFQRSSAKRRKELEMEVARTFGFHKIQQAINWKSSTGSRIRVVYPANGISKTSSEMSIKIGKRSFRYTSEFPEVINVGKLNQKDKTHFKRLQRLGQLSHGRDEKRFNASQLARFLLRVLNDRFFGFDRAVYLPAGRVGLMDSFRTIVGSSIQSELDNVTIGEVQSPPLTGVSVDFLQMLTAVTPTDNKRPHNSVASQLEQELLHGTIEVILNQMGFPYFFFKSLDNEQLIPLNLTSSMISQLAPVVLFLRGIRKSNNLIIIEEPEAHLHPMQQVRLLQEISKWTRDGNKVILTTHSEWVTEALSNLVMENKIDPKAGMESKDIGLWRFIGRPKGTEIIESVWNTHDGGYDEGFEEVGDELLNEWTWYEKELS